MKALVCGAGGFLGNHLTEYLKERGYWVRGVGRRQPTFVPSVADEYLELDLSNAEHCRQALTHPDGPFDEVYQLAAEMGGIGFIESAEVEILRNSTLINLFMTEAAAEAGVGRYLLASSACVYRDMLPGEPELSEESAYPAMPNSEYGWEKLYAERIAQAYSKSRGLELRIVRMQTSYGPNGPWEGGREKAPCALCRKVIMAADGEEIEVWGDGSAVRSYVYVDDMVSGLYTVMQSELSDPVNIGSPEYVSVRELVEMIIEYSGKNISIRYVPGPVGVQSRNFSNDKIYSLGWKSQVSLREGIAKTYDWIASQITAKQNWHDERIQASG